MKRCLILHAFLLLSLTSQVLVSTAQEPEIVSFSTDVRPVLAANCFGCHQGAINSGGYVMTDFEAMVNGGDSGDPAIVPGKPDESPLLELIVSHEGVAEMPPNAEPLLIQEVASIRNWIEQGATNNYTKPVSSVSPANPPVYSRLPVLTSIDFSPDGKLMALNGFHEVIVLESPALESLQPATDLTVGKIIHRLIGLSSRIESIKFSPDGTRLAVSGGSPGEFGEVQVWNVESGKLELSRTITFDSVSGVNWSPDGSMISFGCTDATLRAINSKSGEQVLFQGAHEDWIRDSVFSADGSKLVSVGRDMSCKLTEVTTQRFVDNITSITPGGLKGGIAAVDRHPTRDEVVIGGSDGIPKVYRMERLTKRVIGDDANLIRQFPEMPGRIHSVAVSKDGKRIVAGSSLNGAGNVHVYSYEFDTAQPENIKAIVSKVVSQQSADEKKILAEFVTQDAKQISSFSQNDSGVYAVNIHPEGKWIACGGSDGMVRIIETETGNLLGQVQSVPIAESQPSNSDVAQWQLQTSDRSVVSNASKISGEAKPVSLVVSPESIAFGLPTDYVQFVVQAVFEDGSTVDVTCSADYASNTDAVVITDAMAQAAKSGTGELTVAYRGLEKSIPVQTIIEAPVFVPDFVRDVNPVLSKLGCNAGTCHGSQGGKKGFKLSLRGYDPIFDIRAFTDDMASRRTNLASPSSSLMLLKPTGQVPHEGGKVIREHEKYYSLVYEWIRNGAKLDLSTPKVVGIELLPKNPVLVDAEWNQQMRVVATYADGKSRDVTREAVIEAGNLEVAVVDGSIVTANRRGEAPILARYEGAFTATTLTVMGRRDGFVWRQPASWGEIDNLTAAKWQRLKIVPSELCDDAEFIRRIYLDLTGLPPSASQVDQFIQDARPTREKRDVLIDELIGNDSYVEHWANKWADLMQVNRKYLAPEGAQSLRNWIREQVQTNRRYDEFANDILTASGSNKETPQAAYYKIHRTPDEAMENTTHLFLGTRFNCNKCHDHPFERWTQDQYYQTAAFFAQVERKRDPASGDRNIGGSAVEGATSLYEIIADATVGEVTHERTGEVAAPQFPFECNFESPEGASRRQKLAAWITSPDNPYFATSYVNRLWGYLTGVGLIEPIDDIRAGNPASNPQLLEFLRKEFIEHDFDTRHVIRLICKSRTYQLSVKTNPLNDDDKINYSHATARRLPAEVLFDSIHVATGSEIKIPGVAAGTRAAALPDSGVTLPSGFLSTLGRPSRESACECERANDLQLGSVLALVSGPDLSRAIGDPDNGLAKLVKAESDDRKLVDQLFLQIVNRHATEPEIDLTIESFQEIGQDHAMLLTQRDDRKAIVATERPKLEEDRVKAIANVQGNLDGKIAELDPELLSKEAKQKESIAVAEKAVADYENGSDGFAGWKNRQLDDLQWHPLLVSKFESESTRDYTIRADRSVLLEPKTLKDVYTVRAKTDLSSVSAVRLEMLADDKLPNKGPGLANGNLVLTEFEIEVAHPEQPDSWEKVAISSAIANFTQAGFPIEQAFDGETENQQGWAVAGSAGKTSWATFQLKMPFGYSHGTLVRFKLHQRYDTVHQIGCFRISLTKFHGESGLGLSETLLAELAKPETGWTPEIKTQLTALFNEGDPKLVALRQVVVDAKQPLAIDPQIVKLREQFERVSQPVPDDVQLLRLEKDVLLSTTQMENNRLTAAQDLAWALINSPSFLFNR